MKKIFIAFAILMMATTALAGDIGFNTSQIIQGEFDSFVKEFGTAISFNPMAPAEPLGITGFDVAAEVMLTDISDSKGYWTKMVDDYNPQPYLPAPRLHLIKGLPFGIDVGAIYSAVPDSNIVLWGLEVKYAILEGSIATPALSIRGSYSQLDGVDDVDLNTQSIELMISKGILMLTPYAGVGVLWINGSENSSLVNFEDVNETLLKGLAGVQISPFPLVAINAEAAFGDITQYGLKIAIRF